MAAPGPGKALCDAQLPNQPKGVTCRNRAGARTEHLGVGRCYRHGGKTETHNRSADMEIARRECAALSVPVEIDPGEALLQELCRTWGWIRTYDAFVQNLGLQEGEHWGRLYGPTGMATGEAKPHVAVELLFRERQHAKAVAEAAIRAHVDVRRMELHEQQVDIAQRAFEAMLVELKLSADQRQEARQSYARHLRAVN